MVVVPGDKPATTPELSAMVALVVSVLLQMPPATRSLNMDVEPTHTVLGPKMGEGCITTMTLVVFTAMQPDPGIVVVTVYTPLCAVVMPLIAGLALVEVYAAGPFQKYPAGIAVPVGIDVRCKTPPSHTGASLVAVSPIVFTSTFVVAVATHPEPVANIAIVYVPEML